MLKGWLDAGKCLLGAHQGDWALEAHGSCRMVQRCTVCGAESRRVEHLWTPWSAAAGQPCASHRTCVRCAETETRVEHQWQDWSYRAAGECEQSRPCARCSDWDAERRLTHVWGPWQYDERHRSPLRRCDRCATLAAYFPDQVVHQDVITGTADESRSSAPARDATSDLDEIFNGRVDEIVTDAESEVQSGYDDAIVARAINRLQALDLETEAQRLALLSGYLRLADVLIAGAPPDAAAVLEEQRRTIRQQYESMYGSPDAPYAAVTRVIGDLAHNLRAGGAGDVLVEDALAAISRIAFRETPDDELLQVWGRIRVAALQSAHRWLEVVTPDRSADTPIITVVRELGAACVQGEPLPTARVLDAAERIAHDEAQEGAPVVVSGLLHVVGLGLLFHPGISPALEPIRDRLMSLMQEATAEETPPPAPRPLSLSARCDDIIAAFAGTLAREGFSEYALQQATAAIGALPTPEDDDVHVVHEALLRMIDISKQHVSPDIAEMLDVARAGIVQQREGIEGGRTLAFEEVSREAEGILRELRANLAAGLSPEPVIGKALLSLQALAPRIASDDEKSARMLMDIGVAAQRVILPYVPEHLRHTYAEHAAAFESSVSNMDALLSDDSVDQAVASRQIGEQMGRAAYAMDPRQGTTALDLVAHARQVGELVPQLLDRMMNPMLTVHAGEGDEAEIGRLRKAIEAPMQLMRYARTEDEFMRPQREGLRRAATEFRQFERRNHLMAVYPPLSRQPVTVDANAVFYAGSPEVASLVEQAVAVIGMRLITRHSVTSKTEARWQQLRESVIAVCDFSPFDPSRADMPGPVPRDPEIQRAMLAAAAPVAAVAYETGWAYVLGKPLVIASRRGGPVPFDIDVQPVLLGDGDDDVPGLVAAIQGAIYGNPQGVTGSCLSETIDHVRGRYEHVADPRASAFLTALSPVDATRTRRTLEGLFDRISEEKPLLVLPTYAGAYPAGGGGHLFHVTAFREWSTACQQEARAACERAGVEYQIGYDRVQPNILQAIWKDICGASYVIADITNLNPNAVLELGMAHALGRKTLILTQNADTHVHLPAIDKLRIHRYDPERGRTELARLLDSFIAGAE